MFGDSNNSIIQSSSGNGSSIIKSGYDPTQIKGAGQLKSQFSKSLDLDPEQAKEGQIHEAAKMHGKYKALAETIKRLSKEKLGAAEGINQVYGTVMEHAVEAAKQELKWQQTTQKGLEGLSPLLLDMGIHQEQHAGYVDYLDIADRSIKF